MFTPPRSVTLVEDDAALRDAVAQSLQLADLDVQAFPAAEPALARLRPDYAGVVVSDIRMPGLDGRALFRRLKALDPELPVILITGHADVAEAVEALHEGAYDFVAKPFPPQRLVESVRRALEKRSLVLDNRRLRAAAVRPDDDEALVGDAAAMVRLRAAVAQLAGSEVDVLIEGETGSGKEVVARRLHALSRRARRAFVVVDCAALPDAMLETELFGYAMGAFQGAIRGRTGRLEAAAGGTLFLDGVESLPLAAQAKLLRVIEDRQITRLGDNEPRAVDLRLLTAAGVDLAAEVAEGRFRADLFYRLNVVRLRVPPLRERGEDVPRLFGRFLAEAAVRFRREPPSLSNVVRERLLRHDWPGNVRELRHFADQVTLGVAFGGVEPACAGRSLHHRVEAYEADVMREALRACGGDVRAALVHLGLPRKTFYDKVRRHGLDLNAFRRRGERPSGRGADHEAGEPAPEPPERSAPERKPS